MITTNNNITVSSAQEEVWQMKADLNTEIAKLRDDELSAFFEEKAKKIKELIFSKNPLQES